MNSIHITNRNVKPQSRIAPHYSNGSSGADEYRERACKWHNKSYTQIAKAASKVLAVRDEETDDLLWAV